MAETLEPRDRSPKSPLNRYLLRTNSARPDYVPPSLELPRLCLRSRELHIYPTNPPFLVLKPQVPRYLQLSGRRLL